MSWFGSKPSPKGIIRPSVSGTLTHWSWWAARAEGRERKEIKERLLPLWLLSLSGSLGFHFEQPPPVFSGSVRNGLFLSLWTHRKASECKRDKGLLIISCFSDFKVTFSCQWWRQMDGWVEMEGEVTDASFTLEFLKSYFSSWLWHRSDIFLPVETAKQWFGMEDNIRKQMTVFWGISKLQVTGVCWKKEQCDYRMKGPAFDC